MSTVLDTRSFLRWCWRQLTSMRTALILLLLLAVAAIPGSLFPQRSQNPIQVKQFFAENPETAIWLDRLSLFNVFSSPWFSAIYLLLFISLIGCVLPRSIEHLKAIGAKPPLTPKYLDRMEFYTEIKKIDLDKVEKFLRKKHFRIRRDENSISAEKGYARETGNLLFHLSLVLILLAVGIGSLLGSRGDAIVNVGDRFINTPTSYDILSFGKYQAEDSLPPFSLIRSARFCNRSILRAAQTTATPLSASISAICSPKPLDAPLISAILPFTEKILSATTTTSY